MAYDSAMIELDPRLNGTGAPGGGGGSPATNSLYASWLSGGGSRNCRVSRVDSL